MAILHSLFPSSPNTKIIKDVAKYLIGGALVIYPTDTVYALGCLSSNHKALSKLAKLKEVKVEQAPFSFLFSDLSELSGYVQHFDSATFRLLKRTLPGPYTYIMSGSKKLPKPFDKRKSIGIRISDDPILKVLLPLLPAPLITTSLHDKDKIIDYTTDPDVIFEEWGDIVDIMIETGAGGNLPSTVIDLTQGDPILIRKGKGLVDFI
ncbi:L-threonylcarbamoyladenylate synthase [Flavobacteriaceae bacterium]|nr:L-threonylcarbamoyladenylate synthase [Flavobacteriaceae bacterium]MDC0960573.1 L-threonylcarbamoyladenylate synthase [Flavobacteriaceae bacterium]